MTPPSLGGIRRQIIKIRKEGERAYRGLFDSLASKGSVEGQRVVRGSERGSDGVDGVYH